MKRLVKREETKTQLHHQLQYPLDNNPFVSKCRSLMYGQPTVCGGRGAGRLPKKTGHRGYKKIRGLKNSWSQLHPLLKKDF